MKNIIITVVSVVVIIGTWSLYNSIQKTNEINRQSAAFQSSFMSGCDPDGTQTPYCTCTYSDLTNKLGVEGTYNLAVKYNEDHEMPDSLVGSAYACLNKYDGGTN